MRGFVVASVLLGLAGTARAENWYFDWRCAGACAPGRLDVSGREGAFGSESACERAQTEKALEINGPGSAGSAGACFDADAPGAPAPGAGGSSRAARAARLARAYVGVDGGRGYLATYAGGREVQSSSQVGGQLEVLFGRDAFGIGLDFGLHRDAGTAPMGAAVSPMWLVDIGLGIASSPFALLSRPSLEIRPDLGVYYIWTNRVGCDRCETDPVMLAPVEPTSGDLLRLRVGLDIYWNRQHSSGIAIEALAHLGKLGDLSDELDPTSVELRPPRVMLRVSYLHRRP